MIIAALVVLCCTPLTEDVPPTPENPSAIELSSSPVSRVSEKSGEAKPDAPTPKINAENGTPEMASFAPEPFLRGAVKPAVDGSYETPRKRAIWYALMAANHSAAAFDAWTTRRAISSGYGVEANPLERPFAGSVAIYASTQVCPVVMDMLGRRMMRSEHFWVRRAWWVPQAASASLSFGSGIHNYGVVR